METVVETGVDTTGIEALLSALQAESFADACCVGEIDTESVYLRCPKARHGVIFGRAACNTASIAWAVKALKDSLALEPSAP